MLIKIRLEVLGLTYTKSPAGAYALILGEVDGKRRIPVIIGQTEAEAIAIQLQGLETPRPLTHDLMHALMRSYGITLREVLIYKCEKDVFFSELLCWQDGENEKRIDARTSDAIALAVRSNCPIYIDEVVFNAVAIVPDLESSTKEQQKINEDSIEEMTIDNLQEKLKKAITTEDYERASKIRDEIKKREFTANSPHEKEENE